MSRLPIPIVLEPTVFVNLGSCEFVGIWDLRASGLEAGIDELLESECYAASHADPPPRPGVLPRFSSSFWPAASPRRRRRRTPIRCARRSTRSRRSRRRCSGASRRFASSCRRRPAGGSARRRSSTAPSTSPGCRPTARPRRRSRWSRSPTITARSAAGTSSRPSRRSIQSWWTPARCATSSSTIRSRSCIPTPPSRTRRPAAPTIRGSSGTCTPSCSRRR